VQVRLDRNTVLRRASLNLLSGFTATLNVGSPSYQLATQDHSCPLSAGSIGGIRNTIPEIPQKSGGLAALQ
jgi:hypothetical protein